MYALYLFALTAYAMVQIPPYSTVKDTNGDFTQSENCIATTATTTCLQPSDSKSVWVFITGIVTIAISAIRIVIELTQLFYQKHKYITIQNMTEIALFGLSIYFTVNIFYKNSIITSTQWQIGVFCLLVAWMNLLMFLRKVSYLNNYKSIRI